MRSAAAAQRGRACAGAQAAAPCRRCGVVGTGAARGATSLTHTFVTKQHRVVHRWTPALAPASHRRIPVTVAALPWLGSACHTAPAITPALSDALGVATPEDMVAASSCHHAVAQLMPLDHLLLVLGAVGFAVMLGAVTGQTSVLEGVAHRASRLRPADLFLDPNKLMPSPDADQDPAVPPAAVGGLTGTTPKQVQSYVRLTAGSANRPGVIAVRNQALATAATYSVRIAIKESQARVRHTLEELQRQPSSTTSVSAPASTAPPGGAADAAAAPLAPAPPAAAGACALSGAGDHAQDLRVGADQAQQQEHAVQLVLSRELRSMEEVQGRPHAWGAMTEREVDALELQLLQAVAEQAALEQVDVLLAVVAASQQEQQPPHAHVDAGRSRRGGGIRGGW